MLDDEGPEDEPGQDLDEIGVRKVSEVPYAGRPAVIVRTTHLQGDDIPTDGQPSRRIKEIVRDRPI